MTSPTCALDATFTTPIPRLPERAEVAVYRIAQEALTNAVRHAEAATILLTLAVAAGNLQLEVTDDGRGFDPDDRTNSLGLVSMKERALSIGGQLSIYSSLGAGTTLRLECPVDEHRSASFA
jgi:signal transduction histidine kinase